MSVSGRVSLRLEKRVEIPEAALYKPVSGHFIKAHLKQSLSELRPHFHQRVQMSTAGLLA